MVPGTADTYTIVVSNSGPSTATGAKVADTIPAYLTGTTWTATATGGATGFTTPGSGNTINDTVTMPSGSTITYTVTGTINPTATGSLSNTATVTAPSGFTDSNTANNSATDTDTATPQGDLSITKTDGKTTVVPGTADTYTIVVSNSGPSTATGAKVADTIPAYLTGTTWTATATGGATGFTTPGSGNTINDTVTMPSGSTITYTVTGTIDPTATGSLSNTATVTAPTGFTDTDTANNSATDTDTATPQGDLSITKTDGKTTVVPGTADTYTIVVSNSGPSTATGAKVADTIPAYLTGTTWTATATGGATGFTTPGSGNTINDTVTMPASSTITYTVTGTIDPTATGSLSNTATVTAPTGFTDTDTTNNSATDTDTATPQGDLSITKTDGKTTVVPGTADTYTIVVSNSGPSTATGAKVADTIPAYLTGTTWTATATGGATGFTTPGSGNTINDTVTMPASSTITYTVTGTIDPTATGSLSNTATVTAPTGFTDTDTANNSATDTDTATPQADLSIQKTDNVGGTYYSTTNNTTGGSITAGQDNTVVYTIVVSNSGPSTAVGQTVTDSDLTSIPGWVSDSWTAVASGSSTVTTASGSGNISDTVTLVPGAANVVTFTVTAHIKPLASATGTVSNTATVSTPTGDTTTADNTSTDTLTLTSAAPPLITTTIHAADGAAVSGPVPLGTSVYDTATLSGFGSTAPTGTVTYTFVDISTGALSGTETVQVGSNGSVPNSTPTPPLHAGSYTYQAQFIGNGFWNGVTATSDLEPLTVNQATPSVSTTIHDR